MLVGLGSFLRLILFGFPSVLARLVFVSYVAAELTFGFPSVLARLRLPLQSQPHVVREGEDRCDKAGLMAVAVALVEDLENEDV